MDMRAKRTVLLLGILTIVVFVIMPGAESVSALPSRAYDLRIMIMQESGVPAGDAADAEPATFTFADSSLDRALVQRDGSSISAAQVVGLYGTSDGMTVYDQGVDVRSASYSGFGGAKTLAGADLSDSAGWPSIDIAPGTVAVDPLLGRFAFCGGGGAMLLARWDTSANAHDGVFVIGDYAYLTDWVRGFDIVDISDPEHPAFVSNLPLTGNGMDVVVENDIAYVTMKSGGLHIVDVSDPSNPDPLSRIQADPVEDDLALHLFKDGDLVYVADEMHGVPIYNVSDPYSPLRIGTCGISFGESVWVEGDYAYLTGGTVGFHIYDISDPTSPQYVSSLAKISYTYDVQVLGDYAYVAEGYAGLRVIDVSDPQHPTDVALVPPSASVEVYDVRIANGYAYVAERLSPDNISEPGYVELFDLSNPTSPVLAKTYQSSQRVNGVFPVGALVYGAGQGRGLLVIHPNISEAPAGPVTVDYNWVDSSVTPTPVPTIDPSRPVTLTLQTGLQGRGTAPSASWSVPISVRLDDPGGAGLVISDTYTCDTSGQVVLVGISQGDYEIRIDELTSLSNVRNGFPVRVDRLLDMDVLFEGDCNGDERINILDFSLLASCFGAAEGEPDYRPTCDLNRDSVINILDFSLLAANYDMIGPREITSP